MEILRDPALYLPDNVDLIPGDTVQGAFLFRIDHAQEQEEFQNLDLIIVMAELLRNLIQFAKYMTDLPDGTDCKEVTAGAESVAEFLQPQFFIVQKRGHMVF